MVAEHTGTNEAIENAVMLLSNTGSELEFSNAAAELFFGEELVKFGWDKIQGEFVSVIAAMDYPPTDKAKFFQGLAVYGLSRLKMLHERRNK